MKERPILFSGEMVRAILDNRKTMTRRVVTKGHVGRLMAGDQKLWPYTVDGQLKSNAVECPYGQPGDRLWVKETFLYRLMKTAAVYRADIQEPEASGIGALYGGWKPSIFMPRAMSRITLEVTDVRVERVASISLADVICEGIADQPGRDAEETRGDFRRLWDSINAKRGYGWNVNPWVWVVQFHRL